VEKMDENYLTVVDENGNEVLCEILFTFDSDEYEKSYVLYVPVETKDEDEDVEVLCSSYVAQEDEKIGELMPIEDDEEWEMIEEVFNTYVNGMDEDEDYDDEDEEDEDDHDCCCNHNHDDEECCHHDEEENCGCHHGEEK